ncbi:TetR/AcrR family transcriptional regulator [Pelomonas sp. KK5]|uniref:TetR/AcrR family transcriptional regulator n=1 Tax=Pelomonas sp. KK5 TaxID=1855730 RepID=UPI00097CBF83|nr:TetR/AcrR family transcriptional regulator [Pelomonas sp. KK5]
MSPRQTPEPPPRRRDAAATRQAILDSARAAFARAGYDGAGVREIAAGAGVTAMLVNRYFGSKEALFTEAVEAGMVATAVLLPRLLASEGISGRELAATLIEITKTEETPLEGFQIMLRSAGSARAAAIARELIEKHQLKPIAATLEGALAPQRAALMLSLIAGFQMMRQTIGLAPLAKARAAALADALGPLFQHLIDGD